VSNTLSFGSEVNMYMDMIGYVQSQKLTAGDGAGNDYFGYSVSIDGDTAVIGAFGDDDDGSASGSAYVFTRTNGIWTQVAKLTAASPDGDSTDYFGHSVSIDGDTVVIGAYNDESPSGSGSVYVFTRNTAGDLASGWTQIARLKASDAAHWDSFGYSVSIDGDTMVIGARGDDSSKGSAYVFTRDTAGDLTSGWTQRAKLTAGDGAGGDRFGQSVSISGDAVVIGAFFDDDERGSAYVFTRNTAGDLTSDWTQVAKLTADDGVADDRFGYSVSIDGDTVVIGAYQDDDNGTASGSAYVFTRDTAGNLASDWTQHAKLTANDGAGSDYFGYSVSIDDDTVVIGAYQDDDKGGGSGSAYVFTRDTAGDLTSGWTQTDKLTASDGAGNDLFGYSVAISGNTVVIGAYLDDSSGSAYIFIDNPSDTRLTVEATELTVSSNLIVSGNTETKNINMLHTANTASIKLNSNVVAEFPRSKKLIKYPRVALTSDNDQGYTVTSSSEWTGQPSDPLLDWRAFDNISTDLNYSNRWRTDDNRYTDNYTNETGNPSSPTGSSSEYLFTGSEPGDWIALELPEKMSLKTFRFSGPALHTPYEGIIYGYDTTTTSWKYVGRFIYKTPRNVAWQFSDETLTVASGYSSTVTYTRDSKSEATYSPMYYTDNNLFFSKYAMIINKTNGHHAASLYSWELYGVPEYDPEVHGTDIIMRSVNNIPNTDWLVVYYDGQDYTSVENTINNKTGVTAQNATISNSGSTITFDSDYKAWKFGGDDTRTDTFIATLPSTFVGNQAHSASIWFRMDKFINTGNDGDDALFSISASGGEGTDHQALGVRLNSTFEQGYQLLYYFWGNDVQISFPNNETPSVNKWYHLVVTYDGEQRLAFIDGQYAPVFTTSGGGTYGKPLNLPASAQLQLGRRNNNANEFHGSIANFRLYNRPISEDEIWQLYAYQKEFFNKEPNVITFKNGRLGVGTTEPRAVLDIRGDILVNGMRLQFLLDGSSPEKAAPSAVHLLNNNMRNSGFYWIRPEGYGAPTQIYCDLDGTESGIGIGGWMRVEYAADRYTQGAPLTGTGGPSWSGLFTFVQDTDLINAMKATATQVRQTLESWGAGSVGWTYVPAYMGLRAMGGYTGTAGTAGVSGADVNLPPNTTISFNGWNAQGTLARGTDPTDHNNNSVWDQSVAYFVETPTANTGFQLPITEIYSRDVDSSGEQRYWPLKTGYNSYIWIK